MPLPGVIGRLWRTPDYRRIWLAGGIANAMRWVEMLAASLWTYEATGSALMVSLVAMTRALPMLLLGAMAGALADRLDRRRLLLALQVSSAAGAGAVALLAATGQLAPWHLMLQGLVAGLAWAGEMATRRRMAAEAAPPDDLVQAIALDTMTGSATRAIGPILGGALFQFTGLALAAALACALHLVAFTLVRRLRPGPPQPRTRFMPLAGIVEAIRLAASDRRLRIVLGITVVMNVFAFCYGAVLPAFGAAAFGVSGAAIGLLAAAEPLGAFLGGLWITLNRRAQPGWVPMAAGSGLFLVLLIIVANSPEYWLAWLLMALGGLGTARFAAMQTAVVMIAAPVELRSRMLGLVTTCIGFGPAGVLAVGALADGFGPRLALAVMAGLGLAGLIGILASEARRR
ncbi:MAG: MFS transporter [Alphaproteobacteria bacterium]|nr:MFS transporter [Alphaproteobacteria bacterium]